MCIHCETGEEGSCHCQEVDRQWIKVEERLPEEGVEVLWWCSSDDQDRGAYVGKRDRSLIVWGSHEWFIDADFTHWMPLPEGPE